MEKDDDKFDEYLATIQTTIEIVASRVAHHTKAERENIQSTPENVRLREEAAARYTKKSRAEFLKTQARKARAEHLVLCSLEPGKKVKRKPLTEFFVKGNSTEDREEWQKERQRHCEEVIEYF